MPGSAGAENASLAGIVSEFGHYLSAILLACPLKSETGNALPVPRLRDDRLALKTDGDLPARKLSTQVPTG
jgi:hypothetical protein